MWRDRVAHCSNPSDGSQLRVRAGGLRSSSSVGVGRYGPKKGDGGSGSFCGVVGGGDGGRGSREAWRRSAFAWVPGGPCRVPLMCASRGLCETRRLLSLGQCYYPRTSYVPRSRAPPSASGVHKRSVACGHRSRPVPRWGPEAAPCSFLASGPHSGLTRRLGLHSGRRGGWSHKRSGDVATRSRYLGCFAFPSGAAFPCFEVPPSFCACAGKRRPVRPSKVTRRQSKVTQSDPR